MFQPKPTFVSRQPFPHILEALAHGNEAPYNAAEWTDIMVASLGHTPGNLHRLSERPLNAPSTNASKVLEQEYDSIVTKTLRTSKGSPTEHYLAELDTAMRAAIGKLAASFTPAATESLIHFDTFPCNMIFNSETERTYLLDWGSARLTDPAHGVARAYFEMDIPSQGPLNMPAFNSRQLQVFFDAYTTEHHNPKDPHLLERARTWNRIIQLSHMMNAAGKIYDTTTEPHWPMLKRYGLIFDVKKGREELKTLLTAQGFPVPN